MDGSFESECHTYGRGKNSFVIRFANAAKLW